MLVNVQTLGSGCFLDKRMVYWFGVGLVVVKINILIEGRGRMPIQFKSNILLFKFFFLESFLNKIINACSKT